MRIFKTKWVARFTRRERIADASLREAIAGAMRVQIDANLGGGIIKQRVARAGQGRSGGYRMLIAYRAGDRAVFLYGFAKNERQNIDADELLTLRELVPPGCRREHISSSVLSNERRCRRSLMKRSTRPSRLVAAMLEMAGDLRRVGIIDKAAHDKITVRHLGSSDELPATPLTGEEIRAMRERAHLSQAVFARYLKLSASYISKLERGEKRPTGPALVLLDVIRRKGIEAIL